ncbi:exodeoxyribonuclease VII large subunit [Fictibacillus iocasae]|uniref:Exodeoxyribonuclease 7 large subunit n=1 Tax=Fictibacillus iocasae TaxID=2715437 RepID=A0ABW2NLX1_9BACL
MQQDRYVPISSVTRYIKRLFEGDENLQDVWVKGELSNVKKHSRGHLYFTLKDENSKVNAVMFAGNNRYLPFKPADGMKVLIQGEMTVYEPMGTYQLYARSMQQDGIGNLFLAYEELKNKLEEEGLFSPNIKKDIPRFPSEIGVITSPTGAAVRDIMITIKRRFPQARITLFPVLVQGPGAAPSIARAITQANNIGRHQVLIVGRGGGSIEELWAFNEETVARAIHQSSIPIISAVGHETDFTISDFVADLRAPTPTAAAEMAVPHNDELRDRLSVRDYRLKRLMHEHIQTAGQRLARLKKSYAFRYPEQLIRQKEQQLDRLMETLKKRTLQSKERKVSVLTAASRQLQSFSPAGQLDRAKKKSEELTRQLAKEFGRSLTFKKQGFGQTVSRLNALSPLNVMERGYSLVYDENNLVKSVKQINTGDLVTIRLKDGQLKASVTEMEEIDNEG